MEDIKLMEETIKRCIDTGLTPLIWGKHGIGKSAIIKDIASNLGFTVVDLRLGQLEVGDLIGMPDREYFCPSCNAQFGTKGDLVFCPVCEKKGDDVPIAGRTVFLPPDWLPTNGEKVLIFFDEINRGRLDVQQATFQIVLDRRIHRHAIPDNCAIVCACNPSGSEYNVEEMDPALLDRFINIKFTLRHKDWIRWAREHGINDDIVDFIASDSKALGAEAIDIPVEITPSPRSYEFLSKLIAGADRKMVQDIATFVIGETHAIKFMHSLKADIDKPVRAKDVFNNWLKTRKKVKAQIAGKDGEGPRFDLIRQTLDEIKINVEDGKSTKLSDQALNNLGDFLVLIPKDLAFTALKDLAPINDINDRLLLPRKDLFDLLKGARDMK